MSMASAGTALQFCFKDPVSIPIRIVAYGLHSGAKKGENPGLHGIGDVQGTTVVTEKQAAFGDYCCAFQQIGLTG